MRNHHQQKTEMLQQEANRKSLKNPLELMFINLLKIHLSDQTKISFHHEVNTLAGKFCPDFLLTAGNKKIAFACLGQDRDQEWRDEWIDALILGTGEIDTIYRLNILDLNEYLHDCIYLIYHYDKEFFNKSYIFYNQELTSHELKRQLPELSRAERIIIYYKATSMNSNAVNNAYIMMERRNKHDKAGHWNVLFDMAKNNPGLNLDQLMELRKKEIDLAFEEMEYLSQNLTDIVF
jgi:hypothetical protein